MQESWDLHRYGSTLFQGIPLDGDAVMDAVKLGDFETVFELLGQALLDNIGNPIRCLRETLISLILLGIGITLLKQLELFFKDAQVHQISFWIIYLLLTGELMMLYYSGEQIARECMDEIILFGKIFIPVFSSILTLVSGSLTKVGYATVFMLIIYLSEHIIVMFLIPLTEGYMLMALLGTLWHKERVEKLMELTEKIIGVGCKGILFVISGIGVVQSMILPFVDHTKTGMIKKVVDAIPGIGGVTGTTIEVLSGSVVLLKNGIGVIGILILLFVTAEPMIKMGTVCAVMKLISIIYGLFGEKQMTWCADRIGQASIQLMKVCGMATMLFILWIMIAVYTTNHILYL